MLTQRRLASIVEEAARHLPALIVTGPRRAGKTTLLRRTFPGARYVPLEDLEIRLRVRSDPRAFLEGLRPPVILDEIQNVPELFNYIRTLIDARPRRMGQWLFTGSQEAPLMQGVTESMAGRAAVLRLEPFSLAENPGVRLLYGGFPEVLARPGSRGPWFSSYLQRYIERDVRAILNVRDPVIFRRFLSLLATRHGQILNKTDLAAPLGLSVPTISEWLHILEMTGQMIVVPPYFESLGRRLVRTSKVYLADSGLACYLLGIRTASELERSPFLEALFEGFVAAEILKSQVNRGDRKELYFFRDQQGLEVGLLIPRSNARVWPVEAKAARTVRPAMARRLQALKRALGDRAERLTLVHRRSGATVSTAALAPGVEALDIGQLVSELNED